MHRPRSLAALACAALLSAPLSTMAAQQAGLTALPDSTVARIDRVFAASLGTGDVPGCGVGIARNGEPVLTRAYGMANLEYGVPNTPETIFESGSVAKQFAAAAALLLAQDGKLSLDDDIRKYLPEVPDFGKRITIRHLLTHTSGLRDQWGLLGLQGRGPGTQIHTFDTILDLVSHQKALNFEPGSQYLYSNTGYALAAVIVQRVSGKPFAQFTEERLFAPLGMTNTHWRDDFTRVVKNRATAYDGNAKTGFHTNMPFTNVHGNGGLLTTMSDMLKWNANLDAPIAALGGPAFTKAMESVMVLNDGRRIAYALGLRVTNENGVREVSHGGATAGYRTSLARYPDHKLSLAIFCNSASANPGAIGEQVADLFLSRPARAVQAGAAPLADAELARYTGLYRAAGTEDLLLLVARDGKLTSPIPYPRTLTHTAPDRFSLPGQGELVFGFMNGKPREVVAVADGDSTRYLPVAVAKPSAKELAAYAGSYWSDELDTRLTLAVRGDSLVLRRRPADVLALAPTFRDGFTGEDVGNVVFTRDAGGRVTGFGVWAGRVRNVRFTREK